jgi:large subunit ribosomal protein L11
MSKPIARYLKLRIKGGDAKPGPPIAPALGSKGLSQYMMEFCKEFNARTQDRIGQLLRVIITIYEDKTYDFVVKSVPTSVAILDKLKLQKGSSESNKKKVGELTAEDVKEIATAKLTDFNALKLESAIKMVAGTARSMGVRIKE